MLKPVVMSLYVCCCYVSASSRICVPASPEHSSKCCHVHAVCAVQLNSLKRYLRINEMLPLKDAFGSVAVTPKRGQQTSTWNQSWVTATGRSSSSGDSSPLAFPRGHAAGAAMCDWAEPPLQPMQRVAALVTPVSRQSHGSSLQQYIQPTLQKHSHTAGSICRLHCRSAAIWGYPFCAWQRRALLGGAGAQGKTCGEPVEAEAAPAQVGPSQQSMPAC